MDTSEGQLPALLVDNLEVPMPEVRAIDVPGLHLPEGAQKLVIDGPAPLLCPPQYQLGPFHELVVGRVNSGRGDHHRALVRFDSFPWISVHYSCWPCKLACCTPKAHCSWLCTPPPFLKFSTTISLQGQGTL